MTKPVYKVLLILKRNPSMTVEEFRHQYEPVHAPWGKNTMPGACRYVRRYLRYVGSPHADVDELDYDVITECWYENEAEAQACADKVAFRQMGPEAEPRER